MSNDREGRLPLSLVNLEEGDQILPSFQAWIDDQRNNFYGMAKVIAVLGRTVVYERSDGRKDVVNKDFVLVKEEEIRVLPFNGDPRDLRQAGIRKRRSGRGRHQRVD